MHPVFSFSALADRLYKFVGDLNVRHVEEPVDGGVRLEASEDIDAPGVQKVSKSLSERRYPRDEIGASCPASSIPGLKRMPEATDAALSGVPDRFQNRNRICDVPFSVL
jgi:hypothetical protein